MTISIQPVDRQTWQQLAPSFLDYNYRQLWDFGIACADRLGAISEHVALYEGNELIGLADVRIKRIPFLKAGIAYINGGPLICRTCHEDDNRKRLQIALSELVEVYAKQKKLVVRIQPQMGSKQWNDIQTQVFCEFGFLPSKHQKPYRTIVLDLSPTCQTLRKQLKQKWRYHLTGSQKNGLTIHVGTEDSLFEIFSDLYDAMSTRKGVQEDLDAEFYYKVQKKLPPNEKFTIHIVSKDGSPIAGQVSSFLGDSCVYLLGATNDAGLKFKAGYLSQWEVIELAKQKGGKWYDLCGIDPEENPGGYQFKNGMGGIDVTAPGPFEYHPDGLGRVLVSAAEKGYRSIKHIQS